ncbi:fused MFS/spermidine synthase [Burkholderia sp. 3C]
MITFLYACTITLSAFLLFQVEPLIGKIILPGFGGSAAVWSTCLLFFQVLLVLGYLYSHLTIRFLTARRQVLVHVLLLVVSLALLPIKPVMHGITAANGNPALTIVGLLTMSIGLPYFMLSTTGPLVQAWFGREKVRVVPYRLFALSNVGSMLGLLSYPIVFEPWLPLHLQTIGWSASYVVFTLVCGTLALRASRTEQQAPTPSADDAVERPRARMLAIWTLMAVCPSVLLMAVTSYLTRNVAPIPLLWVLPLGLYLLSFILCFEGRMWYRRSLCVFLLILALVGMTAGFLGFLSRDSLFLPIVLFSAGLFFGCMIAHGELARLKPHPRYLTSFYLALSVGGAMGGVFAVFIAPSFFNGDHELPLGMGAMAVFALIVTFRGMTRGPSKSAGPVAWLGLATMTVVVAILIASLYYGTVLRLASTRLSVRNFYGTLAVSDHGTGEQAKRVLSNGLIVHGEQYLAADRRAWPTTYYGEHSGVGMAILANRTAQAQHVGVIGLGAGTLAAYGRAGDDYRFYEINPLDIRIARSEFSFLSDSPAHVSIASGDARQTLAQERPQQFDLLAVDAFSGDAIPVHLLTREAFGIYFHNLKPGGMLAVHVTNHYLDLAPIVKLNAAFYGKEARVVKSEVGDSDGGKGELKSIWVLVSDRADNFSRNQFLGNAKQIELPDGFKPWTDDYSSLYSVLKRKTD